MAPEYLETHTFTEKCDVFSFGMILLEVACTDYKHTVFDKMSMFRDPDLFSECSTNAANFLEKFAADEIIDPILY